MKINSHFAFLIAIILFSCKSNNKKNASQKNFFPIANYLESEIHYVDSLPLGITKISTAHDKTDTAYVKSPEFDRFAKEFLSTEIEPVNFEKEFSETSFMDATMHAATFTYSTKNSSLALQRADVIANTTDGANRVSSIYLEKQFHKSDTLIIQKLLWRTRTSFQIITSKQISNQTPIVDQIKMVWGDE